MKIRFLISMIFLAVHLSASAEDIWGPELLEFQLEETDALQAMIWVSGFSYSSTTHLRNSGCLAPTESIGSKELIVAINEVYAGQTITAEQATSALKQYIGSRCQNGI